MTSAHVFQDDWAVARLGMGTSLFSGFCARKSNCLSKTIEAGVPE